MYHPVQRIRLACLECRRQKSRCSGEHPKCRRCQQHGKACKYPDPSIKHGSARPANMSVDERDQSVTQRLDRIERLILDIRNEMQSLVQLPVAGQTARSTSREAETLTRPDLRTTPTSSAGYLAATVGAPPRSPESAQPGCMPPAEVVWDTVNVYFRFCHNQYYSFFHEATFRRNLERGLIPHHLIFAILASAVRFSSNEYFREPHEYSIAYAKQSWKAIVSSCLSQNQSAHLQTVQTISLLAIFDFTAGKSRHSSAWVKIGLSVRMAQDLKLMLEDPLLDSAAESEERRRVFWSIYLLDRIVSCGRARPPAILGASCSLQLPVDEVSFRNSTSQSLPTLARFLTHASSSAHVQGSTLAHVSLMAYTLSRTAGYMLQDFSSNARNRDPPWDARSEFSLIISDLLYVEGALFSACSADTIVGASYCADGTVDQAIAGPGIFALALFHICHCLLYHPFLLRQRVASFGSSASPPSFLARSFKASWRHASLLINLLRRAKALDVHIYASFYGYCLVVAGSIMAIGSYAQDQQKRLESKQLVDISILIAHEIGQHWRNVSLMVRWSDTAFLRSLYCLARFFLTDKFQIQATYLQRFSGSCERIARIASEEQVVTELSPDEEEQMWLLVDYSTMSNASEIVSSHDGAENQFGNLDSSWFDIFGVGFSIPD